MRIYSFSDGRQTLDIPATTMDEAVMELPMDWKRAGDQPLQLSVVITPVINETEYWKARAQLLEHKLHSVMGAAYGKASDNRPMA